MNVTYLCLGGNIGNREIALEHAIHKISTKIGEIISQSEIYETEAWGVDNQQPYLNKCVKVNTLLNSFELLDKLLSIEKELGRERIISTRYEPRTIDIDILFFNDDVIEDPHLAVPHPRLHLRKFVLMPLNDICSTYLHPVLNKTIFSLLSNCKDNLQVKKIKSQ